MKGVLILLVILGHCFTFGHPLNDVVYSFHVPLFFILSGYFYKPSYARSQKDFFKKKLKMLFLYFLVPTLIFTLLTPIFFKMNWYLTSHTGLYETTTMMELIQEYLLGLIYLKPLPLLVSHVWFIRNIVIVSLVYNFINHFFKNNILKNQAVISLFFIFIFYLLKSQDITSLWVNLFISYPLFYVGHLLRESKGVEILSKNTETFKKSIGILILFILGMVITYNIYPRNNVNLFYSTLESPFYMLLMSSFAFVVLFIFSKYNKSFFLNYCGEHSIQLLIIHGVSFKLLTLILKYTINDEIPLQAFYVPTNNIVGVFIYFVLSSFISFALVYFYNEIIKNKLVNFSKNQKGRNNSST